MSSLVQVATEYVRLDGPISSEQRATESEPSSQHVVSLDAAWIDANTIRLNITIRDGYHIGGNHAAPHMVNTQLTVAGGEAEIVYPQAQRIIFPFAEDELQVYLGRIAIEAQFAQPPASPVRLTLRYQACSDRACLAVAQRSIEVEAMDSCYPT